jgi:hypothetical protein
LTGVPVAPTASPGTNTTQLATTAFVTTGLQAAYPVGSIYMGTLSTNPNTLFGFGTWVAFGSGRMLISQDGTYPAGTTGGAATTTLITANLPSHSHSASTSISDPGHVHSYVTYASTAPQSGSSTQCAVNQVTNNTGSAFTGISASTSIGNTGSGTAATTISPYISVYMWNRTA